MIDHEQICLTSSLITTQTLVVVSHTACAHVGGPKVRGTLGPTSWDGMWLTHVIRYVKEIARNLNPIQC